jgi:iron transport multicopper oxidase
VEADDRYDVIPSDLILNNTLQIVYNDAIEPAPKVVVEGWPVLDDTDFVPVLKREMAPADIEYELNVWFDVRSLSCPLYLRPFTNGEVVV